MILIIQIKSLFNFIIGRYSTFNFLGIGDVNSVLNKDVSLFG